jgi:hypothetical protein
MVCTGIDVVIVVVGDAVVVKVGCAEGIGEGVFVIEGFSVLVGGLIELGDVGIDVLWQAAPDKSIASISPLIVNSINRLFSHRSINFSLKYLVKTFFQIECRFSFICSRSSFLFYNIYAAISRAAFQKGKVRFFMVIISNFTKPSDFMVFEPTANITNTRIMRL